MSDEMSELLFAWQPIMDVNHEILGAELFYRSHNPGRADFKDADKATVVTVLNLCASLYSNNESETLKSQLFINVTPNLLKADSLLAFDKNQVVFEVNLRDAGLPGMIDALKLVKSKGYRIAIDDYRCSGLTDTITRLCTFVKIDTTKINVVQVKNELKELKTMNKKLIAEKVEDAQAFQHCLDNGFNYFQGYYLEKPHLNTGKKINSGSQFSLQLIKKLNDKDVSFEEISYLVAQDARLSFQLLKIINSPAQGLTRTISSLKQVVIYLGLNNLKKWAILITMVNATEAPLALFNILLNRARACELFSIAKSGKEPEQFFTTGLLSGIDAIFSLPMNTLLEQLELDKKIVNAVLHYDGALGRALELAKLVEKADFLALEQKASPSDSLLISNSYVSSKKWTEQLLASIAA